MKLRHLLTINEEPISQLSKAQATELQQALNALNYDVGGIDGIVGNNTRYAWKRFKEDHHQAKYDQVGRGSVLILQSKLSDAPPASTSINWRDGKQKISKYFTVVEVTQNDSRRIPSDPKIISNILSLAKQLDQIREDWGRPLGVTSWYRPPAVNQAVGGAKNSQHLNGSAADIYPIAGNVSEFQSWLDKRWDKALGYGSKKGFVHVDLRPGRIRWDY